jgi:hypothetical protein
MFGRIRIRLVGAAQGIDGNRFRVLAASSVIATSAIIGAAITGGGAGTWAALAASAMGQTQAPSADPALVGPGASGPSIPPPPSIPSAAPKGSPQPAPVPASATPVAQTTTTTTTEPTQPDPDPEPTTPPATATPTRVKHVFVISLSSPGYEETFGEQPQMPYLAQTLRPQGELLSNYSLLTINSMPNYIATISGQPPNKLTKGDCTDYEEFPASASELDPRGRVVGNGCVYPVQALTLADQLNSAGVTWHAYMEGMADELGNPKNCVHPTAGVPFEVTEAGYTPTRNPFGYFHSLLDLGACAVNDVPLDQLETDVSKPTTTTGYSFIVPNLCHSGVPGECPTGEPSGPARADEFLQEWVPKIQKSAAYKKDGLIIITFGEANAVGAAGDTSTTDPSATTTTTSTTTTPQTSTPTTDDPLKVGTLLLSRYATAGATNTTNFNPYAMLRSTEYLFGLTSLLAEASGTKVGTFAQDLLTSAGD